MGKLILITSPGFPAGNLRQDFRLHLGVLDGQVDNFLTSASSSCWPGRWTVDIVGALFRRSVNHLGLYPGVLDGDGRGMLLTT